jgi:hypothetical protein
MMFKAALQMPLSRGKIEGDNFLKLYFMQQLLSSF